MINTKQKLTLNKTQKKRTYKTWKKCNHVPCGSLKDNCEPEYCAQNKSISRNWGICNMDHITKGKNKNITRKCNYIKSMRPKRNITMKGKPLKYSVNYKKMADKLPYIWRFLDNKTRKKMITLAKKPLNKINIRTFTK